MTIIATTDSAPPSHRWLRAGLVLIAALEFLDALSGVENIFTDHQHPTALLRFAQTLASIKLALAPLIAGAALVFAGMGNLRRAILALALLVLVGWLLDGLPSIAIHGLTLGLNFGGLEEFSHYFLFPASAFAGAALALKNHRLGLAGLLVSVPTLLNWAGVVAFTVAIMMYGI
ncbi:MAG TPA: hypothetical protein VEC94_16630 [Pseudolabrys sp.]|nr:hypothetical protein [Pseudolabrys sp.]